ncbi:hypothetical protein DEO45_02045 [Rhodanobacter denitrificans]|uniref:Uncharacterized protein n=1 Tax=Rhodanobacter denitrificans TaxID=666685 RepID=A0A368KHS4_9GAMM|nr:hypothetical protein [Rhodanobacter denitrificans]RCS31479.1 hypothetical protein DEO45_02045 [Rhodanobacter denitrificans]
MNEFEWRRQLRGLRQPLAPPRDLWAAIETALDDAGQGDPHTASTGAAPGRRWLVAAGLAASLLLAGGLGWHLRQVPAATPLATVTHFPTSWKPSDPRLAGAAIELDAARMELQLAIRQAPDSPALQRLLGRTERQQAQLRQLAGQAG